MDSNSIDVYPVSNTITKSNNKAFSIKFVRENNENKIKIVDATDTKLNANSPDEKFMDIVIYGSNGQKKKTVSLNGNDTGNSPKLNGQLRPVGRVRTNTESEESQESEPNQETGLNDYIYTRGDYIALEGITENTKSAIKIQGTVVMDNQDQLEELEQTQDLEKVKNLNQIEKLD